MIKFLLVFYMMNAQTGYIDKEHTIPQYVSGPYEMEGDCIKEQINQPPTRPVNGEIKVYQCILEYGKPTDMGTV